jgi:NAD(P)-dependent dehydrogenase (short-subunit alcohol dehydrogenase family)
MATPDPATDGGGRAERERETPDGADGRTVLVTGGSSGIGRAAARAFVDAGWRTYATGRDQDALDALADEGCTTRRLDVTEPGDTERVVAEIRATHGRLDCLVNSAGYGQYGPVEDVPTDRVRAQFDVNLLGVHRLTRAALPLLRESGGTVVTVSSMAARLPVPGAGVYAASKAAVEATADALRAEVGRHGVDVVLVEPGPVETNFRARREAAMADLEQTAAYEWAYDGHRGETTRGSLFGDVTAADVGETIRWAAAAENPPARVPVGWRVRAAIALGSVLPDEWYDRVVAWMGSR